MASIGKAIEIAQKAHKGQKDKSDTPYIIHPIKLVSDMGNDTEKKVAALHDVVEDSDNTLADLRDKGFSEEVVEATKHLTKDRHLEDRELGTNDESYDEFIDRVSENGLARKVKIADLEHNMDITRLEELTEDDIERLEKYHNSWKKLQNE